MAFAVYKPGPVTATRTMGPPAILYSNPNEQTNGGQLYANASLMTQLRADANTAAIQHTGERIEDDQPVPVVILIDRDDNRLGLAAALEGDKNAVLMRLNKSRKAVIPGGVRLAKSLGIQPASYPAHEVTERGATIRTITYGSHT